MNGVKNININKIVKNELYEGYLWCSDSELPKVYKNQPLDYLPENEENPFIVEGLLYCKQNNTSYLIRGVDGVQNVFEYCLNEMGKDIDDEKKYCAHRIEGVDFLKFKQYWQAVKNENLADMEVLKPIANVFVGFEYKNN